MRITRDFGVIGDDEEEKEGADKKEEEEERGNEEEEKKFEGRVGRGRRIEGREGGEG